MHASLAGKNSTGSTGGLQNKSYTHLEADGICTINNMFSFKVCVCSGMGWKGERKGSQQTPSKTKA